MADNKINVTVSANTRKNITVSSAQQSTEITASTDTGRFWAQTSKNWAVSDVIVDNTDYSSKHYAQEAKESAISAGGFETSTREIYDSFFETANNAVSDVQSSRDEALTEVENTRANAIESMNTVKAEAIDSINSTKTTILNDIEFVADGEKEEIKELADVIKDNANTIINRVGFNMFDTILKDHVLTYEESKGLALQGTYVYKNAIVGSRYGYADFYNKVVEEYNEATATETVNGVTIKVHSNGHKFYDIANKEAIDSSFNTLGMAWYYGVDEENERVFLPRNVWFEQMSMDEVGKAIEAGLPNITGAGIRGGQDGWSSGAIVETATGQSNGASGNYGANFSFDASRSNPIYGKSSTVQPKAVKKLLYICVGNTVSDTSWVDVVTQVEGGVKDLEDKKNTIIAEIDANAKSYDTLTKRQITNCLLEIPQRIKLELADGVLTLKAGSEVIVPNGFEEDGVTPRFDYVDIESDKTYTATSNGTCALFYTPTLSSLNGGFTSVLGSGTSVPTTGDSIYYKTDTNTLAYYKNGALQHSRSFPLALFTVSNNTITSISQIFNGMGCIGSHKWLDKGVKILCANGKNEDGTLKNLEVTTQKFSLYTGGTANARYEDFYDATLGYVARISQIKNTFVVNSLSELDDKAGAYAVAYVIPENKFYVHASNEPWEHFIGAQVSYHVNINSDGTVSEFVPKQPFRAVEYNDFNDLSNGVTTLQKGVGSANAYLIQTYSSGTSWYRIWSNGWCEQGGRTGSSVGSTARTVSLLKPFNNTNYNVSLVAYGTGGSGNRYFNHFQNTAKTNSNFTAIASCNEKVVLEWSARGWGTAS